MDKHSFIESDRILKPKSFVRLNPETLKIMNETGQYYSIKSRDYDDSEPIEDLLYFLGYDRVGHRKAKSIYPIPTLQPPKPNTTKEEKK